MNIDKQPILDLLRTQGEDDQAQQAESELPDQVDTDQHADLLEKFGININDLLGGIAGSLGLYTDTTHRAPSALRWSTRPGLRPVP